MPPANPLLWTRALSEPRRVSKLASLFPTTAFGPAFAFALPVALGRGRWKNVISARNQASLSSALKAGS
eukprot:11155218-Lingulodinium_polyedra.AAC.1